MAINAVDVALNQDMKALRPRSGLMQSEYLRALVQGNDKALIPKWTKQGATVESIEHEFLANSRIPLPPLPEQAAIVRYLDYAHRRIRRYIRAKQKLIKLLEEQEQAIIHRAVTRGLNPDVRLKPSGVEWLGEVPEHWEVAALRHRYDQVLGKMLDSKRITGAHSLPYLRNADVQWDRINVGDLPKMDIPESEYGRYTLQKGDLLVCEGGEIGRCAIWTGEQGVCGFQKALHRLRPRHKKIDLPRFMYYVFRAAANGSAFDNGHVSTIAHLTGDKLRAQRFPFPPYDEQIEIVRVLDLELARLSESAGATRREITLLREYRTRLIADVVTGKLDVREEVPAAVPLARNRKPNIHFRRTVLAAEVIGHLHSTPGFGRVKLQKAILIAERHLRLSHIESSPIRAAAGPFDNPMMRSIHAQFQRKGWIRPVKVGTNGWRYDRLAKFGEHRSYFLRWWGEHREGFDWLMHQLSRMDMDQAEIVATLYMAWNDEIISGGNPTDTTIIDEVLTNWDPSKQRFPRERWQKALGWMRQTGLIPTGFGTSTKR